MKTTCAQKAVAITAFLSRPGRAFLISMLLWLASGRMAFATTYTWNGSSGNWTTSTDWSPNGVPASGDTAIIGSGTVTVSSAVTVGTLTMSGGTLTGSSVAAGSFYWSGGYIENTVGFGGGTNSGDCYLDGGQLINSGTWNWNGTIYDGDGSTITNNGTMNITNSAGSQNAYFTYTDYGAPATFYNVGIMNVTAGTGNKGVISDSLVNSGEIYIYPGTLNLANGGTNSVQIAAEYGTASLELSGGTFVCNNSAYVLIDGNLIFSGGTVNVEDDADIAVEGTNIFSGATVTVTSPYYPINSPMAVSGGTVNLDGNNEVWPTTMAMSGGTLTGGPVKVLGPFYWSGGFIENTVQFEGGTNSGDCYLEGGRLINEGTWDWNGTIYDGDGSVISNAPSGTMNIVNFADSQNAYFTYTDYGAPATFYNNAGQVNVAAELGNKGVISDSLVNSGVISINSGTLNLANGGTNSNDIEVTVALAALELSSGTFVFNTGSTAFINGNLIFSGGTVNVADDASISVGETNIFSGATVTVTGPDYPIDTPMVISGGRVNLDGSGEVMPTTMAMSAGTLTGQPVTVTGPFDWSGGFIENTVQFEGGTNSGDCYLEGGRLINEGTWDWNGTIYDGDGSIISNAPSGTMNIVNFADSQNAYFTYSDYSAPYTFYNAGQVTVSAGTGDRGYVYDSVTNYGTITISNGTLSLNQTPNLENGTLNFCISNLTNYGSISIGSSAADLSGTLTATVINPAFVPATGNEWPVMTYGSVAGNFSKIVLPPIGDWEETANASDYVIEIKQTGPAPFLAQNLAETNFALAGGPAVMSVELGGTPPFTNQWYSEIGGITNALQNGGRISGATTNVLTIAYAQTNDDGPYQLFVTNGFAPYSDVSGVGQLEVELEPLFNGNGALWTLNGGATIQNNVLTLTDGQQDEARSAFYYVPIYDTAFRAFFTYQSAQGTTATKADGITFCLQNTTAGTGAVGTGGGSLGYKGITNSVAIAFEQFITNGIEYVTNGMDPASPAHYIGTAPVLPGSGDPINVSILYETNAFFLSMTDTVTMGAFATNFVLNLPPIAGTNQAFVGFTGGDGDLDSVQTISHFTFVPLPSITVKNSGPDVLLAWPTAIGGFQLQSTTNLLTGPWVLVPVSDYGAAQGAWYQITVPSNGKNEFYRLMLPANWAQVP